MKLAMILAVLFLVFLVWRMRCSSPYADLTTNQGDANGSAFFQTQETLKCVPGTGEGDSYYTGENSGGLCGAQQLVHKLGHEYQIQTGIGGSLLRD